MFDLDYDNGSYVFNKCMDQWVQDKAGKFISVFEDIISDKSHLQEIALSIAVNVWSGDESALLEDYHLSETDALCYLNLITDKYQKDIKESYLEYVGNE